MLAAIHLPEQNAIIHCPGHQKGVTHVTQENRAADKAAKQAAQNTSILGVLIPHVNLSEFKPQYSEKDEECAQEWGFTNTDPNSMWKINAHGMILLPEALVCPILRHLHEGNHYGRDALMDLIQSHLKGPHLFKTVQRITR